MLDWAVCCAWLCHGGELGEEVEIGIGCILAGAGDAGRGVASDPIDLKVRDGVAKGVVPNVDD